MIFLRPSIDEYFVRIACVVATRSTCIRRNVGSVLVKDKQILTTGYNGAPSKLKHCLDIGCIRDENKIPSGTMHEVCRGVHSEQNAIVQASLHGISIDGATLYSTHQPCVLCTKLLINAGIVRVVFRNAYPDNLAIEMFREAGVEIVHFIEEEEVIK